MADTNNVPNRKVVVGAAAGGLMTILAWLSQAFGGPIVPAEVALAGQTVLVFLIQYLVPNAE